MLVLAGIALAWVAVEFERRGREVERDRAYAAGALFASWMQAAHRRAQEAEDFYVTALGGEPGIAMTAAELRGNGPLACGPVGSLNCAGPVAPDWKATTTALGQTIEFGVIDDGLGVPMAFVVASPDSARALSSLAGEGFRSGAAAGGVVGIEEFSGAAEWFELGAETFAVNVAGSTAPERQDAMEDALGRELADGDLVAVADLAIVFNEAHVHRRRQPGREYLSEMRIDLRYAPGRGMPFDRDAMGDRVADTGAGLVVAEFVEASGMFLVGRDVVVERDVLAGTAGGEASVEADVINANQGLTLTGSLEASSWAVTRAVEAGSAQISGYVTAAVVAASSLLDGGPLLAVESELGVTGELQGGNVRASLVRGRGESELSGSVRGSGTVRGEYGAADELRIEGELTVSEGCNGCELP